MASTRNTRFALILFITLCQTTVTCFGQYGFDINLKKPKEYDNRVLRSEKSDQKKFGFPKNFIQNTVTHYNYFYNANNKLNEVLDRAKGGFKDDYSTLLPFYNYTLDATAADSVELDSISYKSQTGLALHDLRNEWADNLYLLWGASFYLKKQFDSAYLMFQFINYAFAKKEKDGYYSNIGSRMDGNNAFSISTKEKGGIAREAFSEPPSRNEAFIWQIRNYLAQEKFTEAASLIITLKNDPVFPGRLQNDLEEVQAYWFYKHQMWDSAATHLERALSNATNKQERARWEYLIAQLYELSGHNQESEDYYEQAIHHTTDPILDVYARLFSIRVHRANDENYMEKNIATLLKMAKRDKYQDYRDIIYYMAAQIELKRNNTDAALGYLEKSAKYTANDPSQRNKAFLQLAELCFMKNKFRQSYNFYDSVRMDDPSLKDPEAITKQKAVAGEMADNQEIVERQDSLQRIAAMPEDERKDFVKKLVRQIRKSQGLKDEGSGGGAAFPSQAAPQLFPTDTKGDWYFYNTSRRQKGMADFKAQWGNRPNRDNWRRSSAIKGLPKTSNPINPIAPGSDSMLLATSNRLQQDESAEVTFESLYEKLPLTPEQMQKSNDSLQHAMFNVGRIYIHKIEDCAAGTQTFESLRERFPVYPKMDEVLFNLYYCYNKNGETEKANAIKKLMGEKFAQSNFTSIITTGKDRTSKAASQEATKTYEDVYDLFLEGKFEEAVAQKKIADSTYGRNFWTPQLLYIEAVYYIQQRQDSIAKNVLNNIIAGFPQTALAAKATTMLDVLSRRKQIEEELRNLVINMPDTTTQRQANVVGNIQKQGPIVPKDSVTTQKPVVPPPVIVNKPPVVDSVAKGPAPVNYTFTPETPHYVIIVLSNIDRVFVSETKNAFNRYDRNTYFSKQMTEELVDIDAQNHLLLVSPFKNAQEAIDYVEKARPITSKEIVPWLKGGKYYYSIITEKNLEVLKNSKDLDRYKQFLDKNFPGKF